MEKNAISLFEKRILLAICFIGAFLTPFVLSSINIALPAISDDLSLTPKEMADLSVYFLIFSFSLLFPASAAADSFGRIKTIKAGFLIFSFFSVLGAFSNNGFLLMISRAGQGAGSAFIFANVMAVTASAFEKGERGKAIGIISSSVYLGLTLGPFLGGVILKYFSWRFIFQFSAFASFFAYIFSASILKIDFKTEKKFKIAEILIFFFLILIFSFSFSNLSQNMALLFVSSLGLFLFFKADFKKNDIFQIKTILSSKKFIFACSAAFFHYAGSFSLTFIFSLYLQYYLGFSPQKAGTVLFFMPLFMSALSPAAGKLSDKMNPGKLATSGIIISFIGILSAAFLYEQKIYFFILSLCLIGAGFAFFSSPNTNSAMSSLEFKQYSAGSAFLSAVRLLGQNISMVLAGYIMTLMLAEKSIPSDLPAFIKSFKIILLSGAFFLALAAYFSLKRIKNE